MSQIESNVNPDLVSNALRQLRSNNVYVIQQSQDVFEAESQTRPGKRYIIEKQDGGEFACTCPDSGYRAVKCKHVRAVEQILELV